MLNGGVLFEHFILSHGSFKDSQSLSKSLNEAVECTPDVHQKYKESYALRFWHNCVVWMHEVNTQCTSPIGFWDTILEYRGVSRTGRHLNSSVSQSLPLRTYDRFRRSEVAHFSKVLNEIGERNGGIFVTDNFNRSYRLHGLHLGRERPYEALNLMVNAIQSFPDYLENPFPFKFLPTGNVLASFPSQIKVLKPYWETVRIKSIQSENFSFNSTCHCP